MDEPESGDINAINWHTLLEDFCNKQNYICGYVISESALHEVLEVYKRATTTAFCTRRSTTMKFLPTEGVKAKLDLRSISFTKSSSPYVKYDGVPFIMGGNKVLECQFGPKRECNKKIEEEEEWSLTLSALGHDYGPLREKRRRNTKKRGCEAKITIKQIHRFPQYKLTINKNKERELTRIKQRLLQDLKEGKEMQREERYYIELPLNNAHTNHVLGGFSGMAQTIHPQLIQWIEELVEEDNMPELQKQGVIEQPTLAPLIQPASSPTDQTIPSSSDFSLPTIHINEMPGASQRQMGSPFESGSAPYFFLS
ncbi:hypothetical protein MATL_G00063130 [Megalops atlanticus]|uniref:Uncharacterized protein n=1 Tax=Megalops atlanticus TaxID=7932 RepID=A0A9D3Q9T3_MEGAT|nr:hypothetical protein MATL_G00063130 [Megalops atlanticus]